MPALAPVVPARGRLQRSVGVLAGLLAAAIILMIHAGGLASIPLAKAGLIDGAYLLIAVVGIVVFAASRRRATPAVWAYLGFWLVFGACLPRAVAVAPDAVIAAKDVRALGFCVALSGAALLLGRAGGLRWWHAGWLCGLVLTGGIGVWELVTDEHLWVSDAAPWRFGADRVAAATYINPNTFGLVLLSMFVVALSWRSTLRRAFPRAVATLFALFAAAMLLASQSRAAALGLLIVLGLHALRLRAAHPGALRRVATRYRGLLAGVAITASAAVVAAFTIPALTAHNPVYQMVAKAFQNETARSDQLRLQLIRAAFKYWAESGYRGAGVGAFEPLLKADTDSGVRVFTNLHNTFVEILIEYGPIVAGALLGVLVLLAVIAWRTRLSASVRPRVAAVRTEMLGHVVAFLALGCTAGSALGLPVWWLMLVSACVNAAVLHDLTRASTEDRLVDAVGAQGRASRRLGLLGRRPEHADAAT